MGNALSVVAKVKPMEADRLEEILNIIGGDVKGNAKTEPRNDYIDFHGIESLHFCRFVLIPKGPKTTEGPWEYLHFESNYDGDLETHLNQFVDCGAKGMKEIWGRCEGFENIDPYSDMDRFKKELNRFIKKNSYYTPTFYQGYPKEKTKNIKLYQQFRRAVQEFFDLNDVQRYVWERRFTRILDALPDEEPTRWAFLQPVTNTVRTVADIGILLADMLREAVNVVFYQPIKAKVLGREPRLNLEIKPSPSVDQSVHKMEDVVSQNALTVVSEIAPGWFNLARLKFFLWFLNIVARHIENRGSLGGISTIHFARWVILDNGRYLLFNSNYDGSWENYIGDFVDLNAAGMDWVWQCTPDYPYAQRDMEGFKRIIRQYQLKVQVFYSAYSRATVFNILNDRDLTRAIDKANAEQWLRRL